MEREMLGKTRGTYGFQLRFRRISSRASLKASMRKGDVAETIRESPPLRKKTVCSNTCEFFVNNAPSSSPHRRGDRSYVSRSFDRA